MRKGVAGMVQSANSDTEKKILSILRVLAESGEPLGSITIARELQRYGLTLSERAIRYHLRIMDERGYTQPGGRDGRSITPLGVEELRIALAPDQVGFILDKLEALAYQTTFVPEKRTGLVPINTSIFARNRFKKAVAAMREAFTAGFCVSQLVAVGHEGERLGGVVVPEGKVGLATVCSVAVNGVLLKAGVPVESRFGGVLEVRDSMPRRFTAIINYAGTSLDPSEQYIRAGMTSVGQAARGGSGRLLANFRELPAPARATVEETLGRLKEAGINGVFALGNVGEPVCQIALGMNRIGMVLLGGLNPVAAAVEAGVEVDNSSESGLIDFERLVSFWDLPAAAAGGSLRTLE
jgi:HTH-type transcriptional regulator, global nitrogen regulator NrpRI